MMPEIDEKAIVSVAVNADGTVGARFTGVLNNLRAGRKTTLGRFRSSSGSHKEPTIVRQIPSLRYRYSFLCLGIFVVIDSDKVRTSAMKLNRPQQRISTFM